jgi:Mg/Co/Ni transporter MgtE
MDAYQVRELLRNLDPDEVVDYLGITTDELVDELLSYIEDWAAQREEDSDEGC